jgi:hypothetical protein
MMCESSIMRAMNLFTLEMGLFRELSFIIDVLRRAGCELFFFQIITVCACLVCLCITLRLGERQTLV